MNRTAITGDLQLRFPVREEEHECEQEHGRFFTHHRVVLR